MGPHQRRLAQVEGLSSARPQERVDVDLVAGRAAQVDDLEWDLGPGQDLLQRAGRALLEAGPQGLVPGNQAGQGPAQAGLVQLALRPQGGAAAEHRRARMELLEEPDPLLGEGEAESLTWLCVREAAHRQAGGHQPALPGSGTAS